MKQQVSLVLSGGGARGFAHIGVIEELQKQGFEIVSVTGTSMGAVVGGMLAMGKLEEFKQWTLSLDKLKVFNLLDFTFNANGLVKGDRVLNALKEFIPDENIENLKMWYAAVAVDIIKEEEVVFTSGSIFEAIRASIAIPTVLTPVRYNNSLLVDGGVLNNIPINHAKRSQNDLLIAVNVNADVPISQLPVLKVEKAKKISVYLNKVQQFDRFLPKINSENKEDHIGYFDLINKTIELMIKQMDERIIEKYPPDMVVNISRNSCSLFDFYKAKEMIEAGKYAAIRAMNSHQVHF
jgi:NTE family protein